MNIPKLDSRDSEEILNQIKNLAKQYVPEWRFNDDDPDVGSIFSKIFAGMFENTINKYNKSLYNHYVTFLNLLGTKQLPAVSSSGMVTIDVVPGSQGVYIKKGTSLYAYADNDEGRVYYQTLGDIYATDNKIKGILFTDMASDSIVKVFDGDENDKIEPFEIFNFKHYKNYQTHEIYFDDDMVFRTWEKSDFILKFHDSQSLKNDENVYKTFLNKKNVTWQYYNNDTWNDIKNVKAVEQGIRLKFDSSTQPCTVMGKESRFIRCLFKEAPVEPLQLTNVLYASQASNLSPDAMLFDTAELSKEDFFPFGEQYNTFSDFYISSDEAFVKKGANVKLNIDMQFIKVKINTDAMNAPDNTRYRYIMTEVDFKKPDESDIELERVEWEYWNGIGWAKLYSDNTNEDFFKIKNGNKIKKELNFVCPNDIEPIVVGPYKSFFIRARIIKIKNQFNVLGNYITPYIHNIKIDYSYPVVNQECKEVFIRSNMEEKTVFFDSDKLNVLLKKELSEYPSMYICFKNPITNKGVVKLLFDLETNILRNVPSLRWEYLSIGKYGKPQWASIEVMDLTDNFLHSAIVSLIGKNDFQKSKLFGMEGYFLRICNHDKQYSTDNNNVIGHPIINDINLNTVDVIQREARKTEYFSIGNEEEDKVCNLSCNNICDARVWVNEFGSLSTNKEELFLEIKDDTSKVVYDEKGKIKAIWVEWKPIKSIVCAKEGERVFEIDYNDGQILFGDGKHGKIPTYQKQDGIMIEYGISQGSLGNIDKNEILGFVDAVPFVNKVTNLKSMVGGIDMERVADAAKRMSYQISSMDRIVSMTDFERSICYNDRNIASIKCVPHLNSLSEEELGTISVAVLPKNYMQGYEKFFGIEKRMRDFIKEKAPLTLSNSKRIDILEAMYVEISVKVDIVIDDYNNYQNVYQSVYNRLKKFLDPIVGNFNGQGWEIGKLPKKEIIYNYIKTTKNIKWLKGINIFSKLITLDGQKEVDFDDISNIKFTVPVFGEPEINISINH